MKSTKIMSACLLLAVAPAIVEGAAATAAASTCKQLKKVYKDETCCGNPEQSSNFQVVPMPGPGITKDKANPCAGKKPTNSAWANKKCDSEGMLEQSGTNVTVGYKGEIDTSIAVGLGGAGREPINTTLFAAGLCPVNVHWHLGAEHLSMGQFDADGEGPADRRLADAPLRLGHRCHHYDANDVKFTKEYDWKHCVDMKVGETYEVHWPHSAAGACGTIHQYQTPFYDGVFCMLAHDDSGQLDAASLAAVGSLGGTHAAIGVHGQVFTIVNDEKYYYPDMIRGMIVDQDKMGKDVTKYTGSTTGTTRNNVDSCSAYTPITWQVDRTCHLISASSFDKMCADMKAQADDMSGDLHAHGAREVVTSALAADNHQPRRE